ncbi:hypothetical protein [Pedobacter sp. CFBP9032]|uniref:hypothetical protein n=1 Tax=Pedobacter sp. CFBP9032 TaxID=3096539 RepID=UPI002A6B19CB|nr:hypothetical protein [Pedobacter sp. CFBP9032]MDY0905070.1 hypothetical protein [Pedobacter sp. CFBP9032]
MFEDYQNAVLSAYRKKLADDQLPHLNAISPALLRQECLNVFRERYNPKKDDVVLRTFFGPERDKGYLKVIDEHPTDKFKALSVFFKGGIAKPDKKNLELLAWLIDFEDRPYQIKDAYHISTPIAKIEETLIEENPPNDVEIKSVEEKINPSNEEAEKKQEIRTIQTIAENHTPIKENNAFGFPKKYNKAVASFAVAVGILTASYVLFNENKQCMYWNGERYVSIACDERLDNASVIAFNEETATNLKRILRPDTLTEHSVRKVWYNKVWTDSIDFYTDSGSVPTNSNKRLMPMTNYILNKYIIQKKLAKQL